MHTRTLSCLFLTVWFHEGTAYTAGSSSGRGSDCTTTNATYIMAGEVLEQLVAAVHEGEKESPKFGNGVSFITAKMIQWPCTKAGEDQLRHSIEEFCRCVPSGAWCHIWPAAQSHQSIDRAAEGQFHRLFA